jgi:hypothetical protein
MNFGYFEVKHADIAANAYPRVQNADAKTRKRNNRQKTAARKIL